LQVSFRGNWVPKNGNDKDELLVLKKSREGNGKTGPKLRQEH